MTDTIALRRAAEAATPGPWQGQSALVVSVDDWSIVAKCPSPEDVEFIVAANPNCVRGLLDELDALRAEKAKLVEVVKDAREELRRMVAKEFYAGDKVITESGFAKWVVVQHIDAALREAEGNG